MNGYIRAAFAIPYGYFRLLLLKMFHFKKMSFGFCPRVSKRVEITLEKKANLKIGKKINVRSGSIIRIRNHAILCIGNNCSFNVNDIIVAHELIEIGDNVEFAPNVQIYDHDHNFKEVGGVKSGKYVTNPIRIGNNVWVGANTVILRGTSIGNNVIIGAGSVVKGSIPDNSILIQKRINEVRSI